MSEEENCTVCVTKAVFENAALKESPFALCIFKYVTEI
jgi:hypothetical protein